jgi:hypothetical protein
MLFFPLKMLILGYLPIKMRYQSDSVKPFPILAKRLEGECPQSLGYPSDRGCQTKAPVTMGDVCSQFLMDKTGKTGDDKAR